MPGARIREFLARRYEPVSRDALLSTGIGMLLGIFSWIGYRQLSIIDPFQARGTSGVLFCGLIGALLYRQARGILWTITASIALMILIVAYTPIIRAPAQALIRSDALSSVDAVIALSSSVSDDHLLDGQGTDRMLTALQLVKRGIAPNLVATSITSRGSGEAAPSLPDQARLIELAGNPASVVFTRAVGNTRDEATEMVRIARANGWQRIAVVTSPTHTRRACAAFEKAGIVVVCVPAFSRDVAIHTLVQPADRLRAFQLWLYESLATDEYQKRGWI